LILVRTLSGALSLGSPTFLAGAFLRSRSLIESLFSSVNNIAEQALYIKDLFDFFETKPGIVSPPNALPASRPIQSGFEFRDVSFAYPGSDRQVLHGAGFRFDANERIALIGENGAGKTTLREYYDMIARENIGFGRRFENALARAYRREAQVPILDEPLLNRARTGNWPR